MTLKQMLEEYHNSNLTQMILIDKEIQKHFPFYHNRWMIILCTKYNRML
jgi:hypothetical protein